MSRICGHRAQPRHRLPSNRGDAHRDATNAAHREQRVVILMAFIKKTEKTPPGEIELALQRAKELKP